jgi:hypothetical protein
MIFYVSILVTNNTIQTLGNYRKITNQNYLKMKQNFKQAGIVLEDNPLLAAELPKSLWRFPSYGKQEYLIIGGNTRVKVSFAQHGQWKFNKSNILI